MTKGLGQFRRGLAPALNTALAALAFCLIVSSTEALESDTGFATVYGMLPSLTVPQFYQLIKRA